MRVLLVFPQKDRQTGLFIKRAFSQLGHQVKVVDAKTNPLDMVPETKNFKPNLIFCSRTPALLEGMLHIRKKHPEIITSCWNVDKRNNVVEFGEKLLKLFNSVHLFYTIAYGNIKEYQKHCPNTKVLHLQQGCDPQTHKTEKLTENDKKRYSCDVMFAGNIGKRTGRQPLFDLISKQRDLKFKLYGQKTKNFITDSAHNKACQCSKVVLGHNSWPSVSISMSVRDYKIMAAGGFLLTEYCPDIETWFKIGHECDVYKTKEECLEKIRYYIKHDRLRKKISLSGQSAVHEKHRYFDRLKQIEKDFYECFRCSKII
jgi:hypothetical protein